MGEGHGADRLTVPGFDLEGWDQTALFGIDRVHELGTELARLGRTRPLVLCSWRRRRSEEFHHLAGGLGITPEVFPGVEEHVPRAAVDAAWKAAQDHQADVVVSFGGGSAVDLGKAVAYAARHGIQAFDAGEESPPAAHHPELVHVAVPTTYSGAEATACFFVSEGQEKRQRGSRGVRPDLVIADPSLTLTLPWKPSGGTGMTALAHCFEALRSSARTQWTDSLATRAARSVFQLLPVVSKSPKRVRERTDMLAAAYASGIVSDVAGTGLQGGLCTGLGARTGVAHGLAGAILLPHVIRFGLGFDEEGLARFAEAIGAGGAAEGAEAVAARAADLGLPGRLREVGVFEQDLELVAEWVAERSPEARQNARPVSASDAMAILRAAW